VEDNPPEPQRERLVGERPHDRVLDSAAQRATAEEQRVHLEHAAASAIQRGADEAVVAEAVADARDERPFATGQHRANLGRHAPDPVQVELVHALGELRDAIDVRLLDRRNRDS
jgi:hypothetical protein